jgi:hypothetical protein
MRRTLLTAVISLLTFAAAPLSAQASELWLTMDQVRSYNLKTPVAKIIIGNPAIADVTVQSSEQILMYGKTPGLTNIYLMDKDGNQLDNIQVRVQSPSGRMLVVHRGAAQATYSCTKRCELTPTVGDADNVFGKVLGQAQTKNAVASSGGE